MHRNQLSKATLLLAIDQLKEHFPRKVFYFPSYELVMDELRDYRFMPTICFIHLCGSDYLWEAFDSCYFSRETRQIMKEWGQISKALHINLSIRSRNIISLFNTNCVKD